MTRDEDIRALLPCAGSARRLGTLPCSKELLEVPTLWRPEHVRAPVIECALDALALAGVSDVCLITRPDKTDIAARLGLNPRAGIELEYREIAATPSILHSLTAGLTGRMHTDTVLAFPDIVFTPIEALGRLLDHHRAHRAALTLALFPTDRADKTETVAVTADGRVREVFVKRADSGARQAWILAVWRPEFSRFLRRWVEARSAQASGSGKDDYQTGALINDAIGAGLVVRGVIETSGRFRDIGTPEDLAAVSALRL
jgi:glucose-1-phosphate thymidylyltransferase